jgi:hypothetical protein
MGLRGSVVSIQLISPKAWSMPVLVPTKIARKRAPGLVAAAERVEGSLLMTAEVSVYSTAAGALSITSPMMPRVSLLRGGWATRFG